MITTDHLQGWVAMGTIAILLVLYFRRRQALHNRGVVFEGRDGKWYWHIKARNNEVIEQSEGYTRRSSAKKGLERAMRRAL